MWNELKAIYDRLQDEESRFLFERRLMYNLSGGKDYEALYQLAVCKDDSGKRSIYTLLKNRDQYSTEQPIVLFGAGRWGGFHRSLYENYRIGKTVAYCDNNPALHGSQYKGLPVLSVEEACRTYPTALFALESLYHNTQMQKQLISLGIQETQIFFYLNNTAIYGPQYFDEDIIKPAASGVFIDGGPQNLSDTVRFVNRNPEYAKVYAFEPEVHNYEACLKQKKSVLDDDSRVEVVNAGLWSTATQLRFTENKGSSHISDTGRETVSVVDIDSFMRGREPVTFIKMDIEGAEMEALRGAQETIKRNKPDLAVCIYHKFEDILEIPRYILQLNPDYRLYIRHYSCFHSETVLYAVQ